jgi:hypothetical protein
MVPVNHRRAVVFGSIMDRWPLKSVRSPKFILEDEFDHRILTRGYDEHEQGMKVLTSSSGMDEMVR